MDQACLHRWEQQSETHATQNLPSRLASLQNALPRVRKLGMYELPPIKVVICANLRDFVKRENEYLAVAGTDRHPRHWARQRACGRPCHRVVPPRRRRRLTAGEKDEDEILFTPLSRAVSSPSLVTKEDADLHPDTEPEGKDGEEAEAEGELIASGFRTLVWSCVGVGVRFRVPPSLRHRAIDLIPFAADERAWASDCHESPVVPATEPDPWHGYGLPAISPAGARVPATRQTRTTSSRVVDVDIPTLNAWNSEQALLGRGKKFCSPPSVILARQKSSAPWNTDVVVRMNYLRSKIKFVAWECTPIGRKIKTLQTIAFAAHLRGKCTWPFLVVSR
ncbi:hypothetical protein C8R45DRAFT_935355 [Mycena sanguinolenta]|nr:hypothetical protein C8R45DRAFT_935355 [Mycena sanguinolenta]